MYSVENLHPSLRAVVEDNGLDGEKLGLGLQVDDSAKITSQDRHLIVVHDSKKAALWQVPTLRELFRGNRAPPLDMDHYPPEYVPIFYFVERHLLTICDSLGDRTDQEIEEIYSLLRRRPDGKSIGPVHDALWQTAAMVLGTHPLSQAEFDAIFGALARSTRCWGWGVVSRNYVAYLRSQITDAQ